MVRPLTIGMYSPFFGTTLGGGEKYFGVTAEAIRDRWPAHRLEIATTVPVDRDRYERQLNLNLGGIEVRKLNSSGTWIYRLAAELLRPAPMYRDLFAAAPAAQFTRRYDLLLPMAYVHSTFSRARRTVMLCQFPYEYKPVRFGPAGLAKRLYRLPYRSLRAALLGGEVMGMDKVICQSEYVARYIRQYWGLQPAVVHPPIDIPAGEPTWTLKAPIILSVGRFFRVGHNKRHDVMIEAFKALCDEGLRGWELHLAGSVHRDGPSEGHFETLRERAAGYPIRLHGDVHYDELQDLYRVASVYWHAAGYGVDAEVNPADLEHFGMTTVEAMANGVVPVVIRAGGQPEVVEDARCGFTWWTIEELQARTRQLVEDPAMRQRLGRAARERSKRFARERFKQAMIGHLEPIVSGLESS
jgi:glycosyltransferase involved in cell wall biosynthesis